jgi:hypothetical protein
LSNGVIETITIPGAHELLKNLHGNSRIGIPTANLLGAAELRLKYVNLWPYVSAHAFGAEGGGHKREILAHAIASINLPKDRIVYVAIISMMWRRAFQTAFISSVSTRIQGD